ncbi:efflux transporter outer membrane subunit [Cupriavidus oxalaticus]|uniref:TolC family protein n=1 Tax=Cupriavidus oxalaticus TaxID=96344 RepID=A0A4P7LHV6_9BURK|nr:TolC family protein [Cupriavidus oxalaticus]QBY55228.1 TolC family protein [Cupriavidus oxalaticus]
MTRIPSKLSKTAVGTLLLNALLAGCAVGPDYTSPPTNDMTPFHSTAAAANKAAPAPSLENWWHGFNDPMLVNIVQRALGQNLDLAASIARVQQARAVASSAGAQLLPTVDFDAAAGYTHQSLRGPLGSVASGSPAFKRNTPFYTVGPAASWEIDLFGGLRRGAAAAEYEAIAAEADHAGTRVMVAADAADAYLQIRGYQARLAIAGRQIETDERLLRLVRDRYDAGAAQGREIAQADALLKHALASVPPLRIGLEQQLNRLDVLMGVQPGTYVQELGAVSDIPAVPGVPADAEPQEVLRRRPDIIAAERRLAASSERIGVAISDYYPKISLSGALGFDSLNAAKLFTSSAFTATGGGALRWRLFDFGKVDAEVAQARGANAEALALYRKTVLRAAEDVENAFTALTQTEIHVVQLRNEVQALVKSRDLSEQAYRAGSITLTDVLIADRQLLTARDELEAKRANAARAAVGVFRALGGGWEPAPTNGTKAS